MNMKKIILSSVSAVLMLSSVQSYAGKVTGEVKFLYTQGSKVFIKIDAAFTNAQPFCASGEFALDGSTVEGKNIYAMLLTAKATGGSVGITGKDVCTLVSTREDVRYVVLL